jgi:hypothetical protein
MPVAFACRTPATPNHISVPTAPELARPNKAPMSDTVRFIKAYFPFGVGPALYLRSRLLINLDITQYQKAPTFAVSYESLKHHTYQKGAPL